ncbi:MAG: DNA-3-methyladenine glycosylase 2 family protein [Burkholderiales bacterium]|nr:DNA-3-methyladenine glycosylase 2 family protein [Anaerolineae bacterium]
MTQSTKTGRLAATAPFDFTHSLRFIGVFTPAMGDQAVSDQTLTKAIRVNGQTVAFTLGSNGSSASPELRYTLTADQPISADNEAVALERIRLYLSLDDDLKPFYAIGEQDEQFAPIIEQLYGYHQVRFTTPFENAVWAILSQRTSMAIARSVKQTLTEAYGGKIEVDGVTHFAVPEPADFNDADRDELRSIVSAAGYARKTDFLISAIDAFHGIDEAWLREGDYDEVEAWLRGISGIGEWSASFIMLRGLGHTERLPVGERRTQDAFRKVYGAGTDMERIAEPYGDYQGYWAHYLRAAM